MIFVKFTGLALALGGFFAVFVFGPGYDHLPVQGGLLVGVILVTAWRTSFHQVWGMLKFCIPFVLTLLGFGLLFHFSHFLGRDDWLRDSLIKALIFPSSLVFLKLILTFITYLDLLRLPLAMTRRVDLITFKAALSKGGRIMGRFKWYLDTSPQPEDGKRGWKLRKYGCLIMALYLYLYEEIEHSRRVMENRIRFLSHSSDLNP